MSKSLTFLILVSPKTADAQVCHHLRSSSYIVGVKRPSTLQSDPQEQKGNIGAWCAHTVVPVDVLEDVERDILYVGFKS
jgi:hypothetical protein